MEARTDWLAALPFSEVWCIDFEYYPGRGLANGGVDGDPVTPHCFFGYEVRSGRTVRLQQDELGPFPPYRLDNSALIISYGLAAEFGCHLSKGWGEPACAIDALVEFRHHTNDGRDRDRSLGGALNFFGLDGLDVAHKKSMRDRILQGPPFIEQEKRDILDYCKDDVRALARLLPRLLPTIRSWPHALLRGRIQWAIAKIEHRGLPIDLPLLTRLRRHWDGMRTDMVTELDPFGIYEIAGGVAHWRNERFEAFVAHYKLPWPRLASGKLCTDDETFREMAMLHPIVNPLRELRYQIEAQFTGGGRGCTQSHTLVGLWRKDRTLRAFNHEIRLRPSQVAPFQHCATARACADPSRLSAAGSAHCRGGERRRQPASGM
jgi:DNA polymerase I